MLNEQQAWVKVSEMIANEQEPFVCHAISALRTKGSISSEMYDIMNSKVRDYLDRHCDGCVTFRILDENGQLDVPKNRIQFRIDYCLARAKELE